MRLIRILFSLAVVLSCYAPAFTQGAQVEVYVGVNFAYVNGSEEDIPNTSLRFVSRITVPIGINVDIPLSDHILLGTGFGYSPRGTTVESSGYSIYPTGPSTANISLNYLDIPAVLVVAPSSFRIFLGPQLSLLTSADAGGRDIASYIEGTSFAIRYGLGFDANRMTFRITGQNGLTDVNKDPSSEWTTNAYMFSVGVLLSKRRESAKKKDDFVPAHRKVDF